MMTQTGKLEYTVTRPKAYEKPMADAAPAYAELFYLFLVGSVCGFILEGLWCVLKKGAWESHTATVWGPFCIIYGIGAVLIYLLSGPLAKKPLLIQFLAFSAAGSVVEYFTSLLQEMCFGSTSWDYSSQFLNLDGRVSLKMSLIWGVLGISFMRWVFPGIHRSLCRMKGSGWNIVCAALSFLWWQTYP